MKRKLISILIASVLCLAVVVQALPVQTAQGAEVTLEVLNPKANIERIPLQPLAERVDTLEGKKVGMFFYSKDNGNNSLNVEGSLANILREMFPTAQVSNTNEQGSYTKSGVDYHAGIANYDLSARQSDVMIIGVAN